jgi:DNA-binding transcriptional LysR family regulator
LVRQSRGVSLTPAGRRLLPYAERFRTLLAQARQAVADNGTPQGPLLLGSLETAAALRLPRILAAFAQAHPAVDLTLATGTSAALIEDVLQSRLDGAFVVGPVRHPELREEMISHEEMVLVTARDVAGWEALRHRSGVKIVVFRAGCSYRARLESMLAERGVVGVRHIEFGTLEGILGCVAAGIGVTMLPRGAIDVAWRDGPLRLHALPASERWTGTVFIRRTDAFLSSAVTAFLDMARPAPPQVASAAE